METFHVLAKLKYDIIFGETLLAIIDAYKQHPSMFRLPERQEGAYITIFRRMKAVGGLLKAQATGLRPPLLIPARSLSQYTQQSHTTLPNAPFFR
jgi:hypothetical protein